MKARHSLTAIPLLAAALAGQELRAITIDFPGTVSIPDGPSTGLVISEQILLPFDSLGHVSVSLDLTGRGLAGGFNGDLCVTLVHNGTMVVLLNRPGVTAANPIGYGDSGMNVILDDSAPGNIHNYRSTSPNSPISGGPTGTWAPDGRAVDPALVTDQSAITTQLSNFNGQDPNGSWSLFLLDTDPGGMSEVVSWSLNIEQGGIAIPDAGSSLFLLLASLGALHLCRRR